MLKKFSLLMLALLVIYLGLRFGVSAEPASHAFTRDRGFEVIAHGAGQGLQPQNTLEAAQMAIAAGADIIETDVHASADGVLVLSHDDTVDAMTDGTGLIRDKTFAELQALDAAQGFRPEQGAPLLGQGVRIPSVESVFKALPDARYILEIKQTEPPIYAELCRLIKAHKMQDQALVASFYTEPLAMFRAQCPGVATSASQEEVTQLVLLQKIGLSHLYAIPAQALQLPVASGAITIITREFVRDMHARGIKVQVWTINSLDEMRALLELGVDGIITDYPDRLKALIDNQAD